MNLLLAVLIITFDVDVSKEMKPALDVVWNSVGVKESTSYDEKGDRREKSCSSIHWQYYRMN